MCFTAFAGPTKPATSKISVREYIQKWSPVAQSNMVKYRIPASIILAQGILESGYGNSRMARVANNHFGIKCLGWKGEGYYQINNERACYRKYRDIEECFKDHARIISSKDRYSFLFDLEISDYRAWAKGLKRAGYATDTEYDRLLIRTIEEYKLYNVDSEITKKGRHRYKAEASVPVILELPQTESDMEVIDRITNDIIIQNLPSTQMPEVKGLVVIEVPVVNEALETAVLGNNNSLKHLIAVFGDTYNDIATANGLALEQLLEFNDLKHDQVLLPGMPVYLEMKTKAADQDMHTLRPDQQLWEVAQMYGVRLRSLERINHFKEGEKLPSGTIIQLR